MKQRRLLVGLVLAALTACSASESVPPAPRGAADLVSHGIPPNVLQFAVGTVNLYGTSTGLNVVVTYRQPASGYHPGDSGALVSSPTLQLPFAIRIAAGTSAGWDPDSSALSGPSPAEMRGRSMTSSSQTPGTTTITTFGQSGGAFALGIEPFNALGPGDAVAPPISLYGRPFCPQLGLGCPGPYPVPLYDTGGSSRNPNVFEAWGGPPAFDLLGNGQSPVGNANVPRGYAGLPMGLDIFALRPRYGGYRLTVHVPEQNSPGLTQNAFARLNASVVLPAVQTPTFLADGNGGGKLAFTMPKHATEAYIQISDYGPAGSAAGCNGASRSPSSSSSSSSSTVPVVVYYTIVARHSGAYALPDAAGPNGNPSICSGAQNASATAGAVKAGDSFTVQAIAFDYPLYEASETNTTPSHDPAPPIRGARGQDDVTISAATCNVAPKRSGRPASCKLPLPGQP